MPLGLQECSSDGCSNEAAFRTRSRPAWCSSCIDVLLAHGGLQAREPVKPPKEHRLCECLRCGTVAHYRLAYTLEKNVINEPTCRACYWTAWSEGAVRMAQAPPQLLTEEVVRKAARDHGFDYLGPLTRRMWSGDPHLTQCLTCNKREAQRLSDITFGCPCRANRKADSKSSTRGQKDLFKLSVSASVRRWDHQHNDPALFETLTVKARTVVWWTCSSCDGSFEAAVCNSDYETECPTCTENSRAAQAAESKQMETTPVSASPELREAWDDETDPTQVMMSSRQIHRFRCHAGHHPRLSPMTYLQFGCPHCRAADTRSTGRPHASLAVQAPEIASQWHPSRNGRLQPNQVGPTSVRKVWWRDPVCGHEWEEVIRTRDKYERLRCPTCRTILDSLAWQYPELAAEWSGSNPVSAWHVRPFGSTRFTPEWKCSANRSHVWAATLGSRSTGSECPECRVVGKSAVELTYSSFAATIFASARSGPILRHDSFRRRPSWSVDILIDGQDGHPSVVVEYDGAYWHQSDAKAAVDVVKTSDLLAAGYLVLRLREHPLPPLGVVHSQYAEHIVYSGAPDPEAVMERVKTWWATSGKL